jgi:CMP-N,N'-diacetyllegionaminic acid synthase
MGRVSTALAVIPARGGSKGLPRKNALPLAGIPLVVHALRAAAQAETLTRTVVSTDDREIAALARAEGAEVIDRPAELSDDEAHTEQALQHALELLGDTFDYVVTLEPTSPLRTAATIDRCVRLADASGAGSIVTVVEVRDNLGRLTDGQFEPLDPSAPRRRQERAPLYREVGTVYVTRTSSLLRTGAVLSAPIHAVVVDDEEGIDINTPLDFIIAEAAHSLREERCR